MNDPREMIKQRETRKGRRKLSSRQFNHARSSTMDASRSATRARSTIKLTAKHGVNLDHPHWYRTDTVIIHISGDLVNECPTLGR